MSALNELELGYAAYNSGDYEKARAILKALVNDDVKVHLYLGWMYDRGLGGSSDASAAEHHFRRLAATGDINGKYFLAAFLQQHGDLASASRWYEEAAESGHVSAAYWAYAYHSGLNGLESSANAQKYLLKAAALGHIFALRDLARQEIASADHPWRKFTSRLRYIRFVISGILLIIKNSDDLRVR
jgi:TPR repeat protein